MPELKPISADAIPRALEKAHRYRLINQPWAAESICLDIVEIDPTHQAALKTLLLARTDQFGEELGTGVSRAREALARLADPYERAYYAGIICERQGKAHLEGAHMGSGPIAYEWFREAMSWYEKAEALRAAGNDDAILRWNTCVRLMARKPHVAADRQGEMEPVLGE